MKKEILIIGYGSIGQRHARILKDLGYKIFIVSKRYLNQAGVYSTIKKAIEENNIEYVIIANETSKHQASLIEIKDTGFKGKILIEKPANLSIKLKNEENIFVGYNLRFHPVIQELQKNLVGEEILSVNCYVGQYLPTWRPDTDYRKCYSASTAQDGGVLKDLSHEIDYLLYLFGDWQKVVASGGKISNLEIDSKDEVMMIFSTEKVPNISLELNYLDRIIQRYIIVNTNSKTYKADLINNTLQINEEKQQFELTRDYTYIQQHLMILENKDLIQVCTLEEGIKCDLMIESIEESLKESKWKYNE